MYFYKQTENEEIVSLQTASIHIVNLPTGFEEISEDEYNALMTKLNEEAEAQRAKEEAERAEEATVEDYEKALEVFGV